MSSLTKDQLKNELINHGVDLPQSSSKKEELVKLYNKHVLPVHNATGDFSSDDEAMPVHTNGSKHSSEADDEVASLSNSELMSRLKAYGAECGPIVASTRSVYERYLRDLMSGVTVAPSSETNGNSTNGNDISHCVDVPPETTQVTTTNNNDNKKSNNDDVDQYSSDSDGETDEPVVAPPVATRRASTRKSVVATTATGPGGGAEPPTRRRSTTTTPSTSTAESVCSRSVTLNESGRAQAVSLRGYDVPSPRRTLHEVRAMLQHQTVSDTQNRYQFGGAAGTLGSRARTASSAHSKGQADGKRSSMSRFLLVLCLLLLLVVAAVCGYYMYQGDNIPATFANVKKQAMDAVKMFNNKLTPAADTSAPHDGSTKTEL